MLKHLTTQNFETEISNGTTLVDLYADWCGPCKMIAPIIEEIATERTDINVGKVNVDTDPQIAIKYGVQSIPTLIVFKDGKEIARDVGMMSERRLLKLVGEK